MSEAKVFYGSVKSHRTFKGKGGGLVVQIEVANKDQASWFGTHEDIDFKFTAEQGKDPALSKGADDPNQMTLPDLEDKD